MNLRGCGLISQSAVDLAKALTVNKHLEELNISRNAIQNEGIKHLARLLCVNQSLKKLNLHECGITFLSEGFAEALAANEHLEELDISNNAFGDDGIQHLALVLRVNQCLKRLYLAACSLTSLSASLSEALATNTQLEELNVSGNALQDDGIQHLAHALQSNQHLKKLDVGSCNLSDNRFRYLACAIQNNNILNSLSVHNPYNETKNLITEAIIPVLIECLQNNTLTWLCLSQNLESSVMDINEAVNNTRRRNGQPCIIVESMPDYYLAPQ